MSLLMKHFLQSWLEFAESDGDSGHNFYKDSGLCANAREFGGRVLQWELEDMLQKDFHSQWCFPFETEREYFIGKALHLNPKRQEWVRNKLAAA